METILRTLRNRLEPKTSEESNARNGKRKRVGAKKNTIRSVGDGTLVESTKKSNVQNRPSRLDTKENVFVPE